MRSERELSIVSPEYASIVSPEYAARHKWADSQAMAVYTIVPGAASIWRGCVEPVRAIDMTKSSEDRFIEGARQHGEGTIEGDAPVANRAYKKLIIDLREMRQAPDRGEAFLVSQLGSENPSIVTWSALHLLPYRQGEAVLALEKVVETGPPLIAFGAEMTLKEWRAGRLKVD